MRRPRDQLTKKIVRALDLFSGAGGSSLGARLAGVQIVAAVDFWPLAKKTYLDNFNGVKFYCRKCEALSPKKVKHDVGPIEMLIASPECTNHSCAKGNAERSELSRETAFQVIRFARVFSPRWIVVENVIQMRKWHRYCEWIFRLKALGYNVREQTLNAVDFGMSQSRKRLFIIFDSEDTPPEIIPSAATYKEITARDVINVNGEYAYSILRKEGRAEPTLQRAERAIAALGDNEPFLLVYYGTDGAGGWQRIDAPLRTITTVDRFAFVRPNKDGRHEMRMLQTPELKKAMGFPDSFRLNFGNRRDRIKLLGNAVCPPVMKAVIEALTGNPHRGQ